MRFDIFTLFPGFFAGPFSSSILKRGQESGAIEVALHDIRDWAAGRHKVCDDAPYGGGAGMVLKAEPLAAALEDVLEFQAGVTAPPCPVILMSPQGRPLTQAVARELSCHDRIALLCGRYEGIDERVVQLAVTDEISIGDYVLSGGEIAAVAIVDAVARLVPEVLGNELSAQGDSFSHGLLEAPHYTRPAVWRGLRVPEVLVGGHHGQVEQWRRREGLRRTLMRRPDLLEQATLTAAEADVIRELKLEDGPGRPVRENEE